MKDLLLKTASILTSVFFIFSGISAPVSFASVNELSLNEMQQAVPALTLEQANAQAQDAQNVIPSGAAITESSPLSKPFPGDNAIADTTFSPETTSQSVLDRPLVVSVQSYEYERYAFSEAADLLRPEYAAAVVLKDLKNEDLRQLANLPFETGILVLHGEIVLFTSGSEDEVGMSPAVKALTDKATFIAHTHPGTYSAEGPSGKDLNEAVKAPGREYVVTRQGVYAYNNQGVLDGGVPGSYDQFLEQLRQALEASKADKDQVEARKDLNQFIKFQDEYNLAGGDERLAFRMGGTLSYTAGLTSASVTALSGSPLPYITAGSRSNTTLSVSSNQFLLGYSVPGVSDVSGFTVSFDNATTPGIETQDVSVLTQLTFGLRGPNTSLALEVVDLNGNKDTFALTNISNTTERFWSVPVSAIANTMDKTQITQLNFIVTQANTTTTTRAGTLYVRTSGLNINAPSQPVVTTAVPPVTNQKTLVLSGTKEANTSILINGVQVVARDASTTWTVTANLTIEGNNTLSITEKNSIGKVSPVKAITLKRDTVLPTGSVNINAGALYATSQAVMLNLLSADAGSGINTMSFSTDNVNWTAPETYATAKAFTLPAGDGAKKVYVKYFDKAGNASAVYSKSIILDTVLPSGTVAVNGGAQFIKQTAVTLNLAAADTGSGMSKMSFSTNNATWTAAETYAASKAWTFATGDGNKTLFAKFQDKAGNWSAPVSVTVLLDTIKPTGALGINSGAAFTVSPVVTLDLAGVDAGSGISTMSFSTNNVTWTAAENYAASKAWTLATGDGAKTVYARFYDRAGNMSVTYSKGIVLDTVVPAGSININSGAQYANSQSVTLNLAATDATSKINTMSFSTDNANWTTPEAYAVSKTFSLPAGDGAKTVYVKYYDKAGNVSTVYSKAVVLDTVAPALTAFDLPADARTNIPFFAIPVRVEDTNASNAVEYVTVTLVAGMNHVPVILRDKAGNQSQITVDLEYVPSDSELTAAERVLRDQWIDTNSKYFIAGTGIDSKTGFPIDVIGPNAPATAKWTQPTSIGFYLQLLADAITKRVEIPGLTQQGALDAAQKTLTSLLDVQTRFGWNGLIPWLRLEGTLRPDRTQIALIDNANLSHQLAVFIGLLEAANLDRSVAASQVQKAQTFLDRQGDGYRAFSASGVFRAVYERTSGSFDGYVDQFGCEVRATIPFLIEYFDLPDSVWDNLIHSTTSYPTRQGKIVETFSAYDGGAFQYFWSLLVSPEDELPNIREGLQNAFLIFNDWMERFHLAGFPSAASLPEGGYDGKLGIDFLKETGDAIRGNYAALYGLASAYRLDPSWVIAKLLAIQTAFPALKGALGFYDAMRSDGAVSRNYYAIDQGSFVLGLIGTGADDFRSFMKKRGLWTGYEGHYAALDLGIQQVTESLPEPPITPEEIAQRTPDSADLYSSGYRFTEHGGGMFASQTSPGIYNYHKTAPSGWVGGFVNPEVNRNDYDYVILEARSLAGTSNSVVLELKNYSGYVLRKTVSFQGTDWHAFQFFFPKDTASVNYVAFSNAVSDFEVRDLRFSDTPVFAGAMPVQVVQTSPAMSRTLDYPLTYTLNGVSYQETVRLKEGNNTITRAWVNAFGEKTTRVFSVLADTVAPAGSININSGALYVASQTVTLNLSATDATSKIDKMSFSTDNASWTTPEAYAVSKTFSLPSGDGAKTVYVKYYDKAGNASAVYSKSITMDTTAPTGSIAINSGAAYTSSLSVTLNLSAQDATSGIDKMSFSTNNTTWTTPQVYAASKTLTVPSGDGTKTVYVRYYDKLGNFSVYSRSIILDMTAPTLSSVAAANTSLTGVTISWLTNEAANTQIEYGLTTAYGQSTALDSLFVTGHSQGVNDLTVNALYHYRVKSRDTAGNLRVSGDMTFTVQTPVPAQASIIYTQAGDRRLFVQNRAPDGMLEPTVAFVAKGVNWSPSSATTNPDADPLVFQKEFVKWYQTDIPLMAQMGINVVRVFHDFGTGPDAIKILDTLYRYGIKVIVTVDSPRSNLCGDLANISAVVNAYKNHPAILMWAIGNEWDINRYYGKFATVQEAAAFTEQAAQLIKTLDANHPVTTAVADSGAAKNAAGSTVPSVDVWGINIYRGQSFGDAMLQWKSISEKPFYIGEFGADSYDHRIGAENQAMQAQMNGKLWDEVYFDLSAERTEGALIGAMGFEWNDEWYKGGSPGSHTISYESNGGQPDGYNDEKWFGIVDINRKVKQTYTAMKNRFLNIPGSVQINATPMITVISQEDTYRGSVRVKLDDKILTYRAGQEYGYTGITVAIIDRNTGIRLSDVRTFNTCATGPVSSVPTYANTRALIDYINSLPDGTILAISIADEGGFTNVQGTPGSNPIVEEEYGMFEALGSTKVRGVKFRYGWAMIAVKGQGVLAEEISTYNAASGYTPVTVSARLSLTLNPDAGRRPA